MQEKIIWAVAAVGLVVSRAEAGPQDEAVLAAMSLAEARNYTWSTAVQDDTRAYTISGKTIVGGYTWARLPMVDAVADRLGRDADPDLEVCLKNPAACLLHIDGAWVSLSELPREGPRREDVIFVPVPALASAPGGFEDDVFSTPPTILAAPEPAPKAFSNARLAVSPPHEELALIVSDCPRLSVEGDIATGVLSETAARLLLAPDNDLATAPLAAEGTFRLVLREGRVVRYKLLLRGIVAPTRKKTFLITQTSETTVRDIGRTTLEIPAEVRLRLGD